MKKYKIKSVSAGSSLSLFITSDRKVLACGSNNCGQLLLDKKPSSNFFYDPIETAIKNDATFCIAGSCLSVVFDENGPPPNTPNMTIKMASKSETSSSLKSLLKENSKLKLENEKSS